MEWANIGTDARTNRRTCKRTNSSTDEQMKGRTEEWINRHTNDQMHGQCHLLSCSLQVITKISLLIYIQLQAFLFDHDVPRPQYWSLLNHQAVSLCSTDPMAHEGTILACRTHTAHWRKVLAEAAQPLFLCSEIYMSDVYMVSPKNETGV